MSIFLSKEEGPTKNNTLTFIRQRKHEIFLNLDANFEKLEKTHFQDISTRKFEFGMAEMTNLYKFLKWREKSLPLTLLWVKIPPFLF